ncbi:MAG: hypothetical protein Salg2KO_03140 [Salibacteraceae bacterium]
MTNAIGFVNLSDPDTSRDCIEDGKFAGLLLDITSIDCMGFGHSKYFWGVWFYLFQTRSNWLLLAGSWSQCVADKY